MIRNRRGGPSAGGLAGLIEDLRRAAFFDGFTDGELWGNYPQTYSLVGLINSAIKLSVSWEVAS